MKSETLLSVQNASFEDVLHDVSFEVDRGETVALIGPGSSGKSVLIKTIAGLLSPSSGTVAVAGNCRIGISFQEQALFDSMTVLENVSFASDDARAKEVLAQVGLSDALAKLPGEISGGMKRRVALARAFSSRPELLLLDDPIAGLDPVSASRVLDLVAELSTEYNPTVIIVSHDLRRIFARTKRVLALFSGSLCLDTSVGELSESVADPMKSFISARYSL